MPSPKVAPPLYGQETYRDVLLLFYAWNRPWTPRVVEELGVLEELPVGETLKRTGNEFTRNVTASSN